MIKEFQTPCMIIELFVALWSYVYKQIGHNDIGPICKAHRAERRYVRTPCSQNWHSNEPPIQKYAHVLESVCISLYVCELC